MVLEKENNMCTDLLKWLRETDIKAFCNSMVKATKRLNERFFFINSILNLTYGLDLKFLCKFSNDNLEKYLQRLRSIQ